MKPMSTAASVKLIGGDLALDFVNTLDQRAKPEHEECLATYSDLVAWSRRAVGLTEPLADELRALAAARAPEAAATHARALHLREALYTLFTTATEGQPLDLAPLAVLNDELARALSNARVVDTPDGPAWGWARDTPALDMPLWPVARAAAELLTSAALRQGLVRECANERCSWLFLDTTRNHSRRYCTMDDCGNRARARRHYHRQRAAELPARIG